MVRLALRRDRVVMPLWVLVLGALPAAGASTYATIYPTEAERAALTASIGANPSTALLYGKAYDLSTAGGWTAWRYGTLLALFIGLACIFTVTRHTRQEEETGRQDLLSSTVLGRYAGLTAALLVAGIGATATGALLAGGLIGADMPVGGSLAFGAATALAGLTFAAVAAVAAQLAEYARTANGIATAVLGATFLLRAVGDSTGEASFLSWLSPIGWSTLVRPFAGERWWVFVLLLGATAALGAAAFALQRRRDVGLGFLPTRLGPATGAASLRSPLALAWRLQRGVLLGWAVGFAVMGALFGSLADGIGDLVGTNKQITAAVEQMGGASGLVDGFLGMIMSMFGVIAALYAVQATLRMRSEETAVRLEPVLATAVGRLRWAGSHLAFTLLGSALILFVAGLGTGLLHGLRVGDVGGQVPAMLGAAAAQLPAVWVVAAAAVLLFGFVPKYSTAAWAVAAMFALITMFGPIVQVSQAVLDVSPFQHVPKFPGAEFTATPLLWLSAVAVAGLAVGLAGFRRRDIG